MKLLPLLLLLAACSLSMGGLNMGTGSHPHVNFAVKGTLGPVEVLHAPTTQKDPVTDLYTAGIYPAFGTGVKITGGVGWAWWHEWTGPCDENGHNCAKTWTDGATAGLGVVYTFGHARIDLRYQRFWEAPFNEALLFTIGVTP
jgi:hypothetical protein